MTGEEEQLTLSSSSMLLSSSLDRFCEASFSCKEDELLDGLNCDLVKLIC